MLVCFSITGPDRDRCTESALRLIQHFDDCFTVCRDELGGGNAMNIFPGTTQEVKGIIESFSGAKLPGWYGLGACNATYSRNPHPYSWKIMGEAKAPTLTEALNALREALKAYDLNDLSMRLDAGDWLTDMQDPRVNCIARVEGFKPIYEVNRS